MEGISKQQTGFKFGKYRLQLLETIGETSYNGRTYRLVLIQTNEGYRYFSLRLYNGKGKFIKQFLFEPDVAPAIAQMIRAGQG